MNSTPPPTDHSGRRLWPWVLSLCLAPIVLLGAAAFSFLTLDRDVAALRKEVMAATNTDWHTKVQLSVGRLTLGIFRSGLSLVENRNMDDARLAIDSISCASVGVYERVASKGESWSRQKLCIDTDYAMSRRGWSRLAGVLDDKEAVLIYVPSQHEEDGPIDICLSVLDEKELVVVATTINADGLAKLVACHAGDELKHRFGLAKF